VRIGSIIVSGMVSAVLLIFSCISLNAARYYSELDLNDASSLVLKPTLVLRDRTPQAKHSDFIHKELK